jgi:hypothetical protein
MVDWKQYLKEIKSSEESKSLKEFAKRNILLSRVEETLNSLKDKNIRFELIPADFTGAQLPGDYIVSLGDYKDARLILELTSEIPKTFSEQKIKQIKKIFAQYPDVEFLIMAYDDDSLTSILISTKDIKLLSEKNGVDELPRGALKDLIEEFFKKSEETITEPVEKIKPKKGKSVMEYFLPILKDDVIKKFKEKKAKRLRAYTKIALDKISKEEILELIDLVSKQLKEKETFISIEDIELIFSRFDKK